LETLKLALQDPGSVNVDTDVDISKLGYWLRPGHLLHPPGDEKLGEHDFIMISSDRCVEVLGGSEVGRPEFLVGLLHSFESAGWTLYSRKQKASTAFYAV